MERLEFEALVQRLEGYAAQHPQAYRRRVGLLAALGYGYVVTTFAIVVAMLGGLLYWLLTAQRLNFGLIKIGLLLTVFAFVIARALWVRFPSPEGIALSRERVPQVFAMLNEMTQKLQAPRFHHVLLTGDFNAAVAQVPKLGILGWQTNYLLLGLPLMQALSPDEFASVVAHELGHLSGNHGRFSGWIYRVYETWGRLLQNSESQGGGGAWIFNVFIRWYAPFFNAYSFVLRRADEYIADRCSAELVGAQAAGRALIRGQMQGRFLSEQFWPRFYEGVREQAAPPAPYSAMAQALRSFQAAPATEGKPAADPHLWLTGALHQPTDLSDTHPALSDRLRALGWKPHGASTRAQEETPIAPSNANANADAFDANAIFADLDAVPEGKSAAAHYLGEAEAELTNELNAQWQKETGEAWGQQHEIEQKNVARLAELEGGEAQTQSDEELWERIGLSRALRPNAATATLLQVWMERKPEDARAPYALGEMLLEGGDEQGIAHLERAMQMEIEATFACCSLIENFLLERGRVEEAKAFRERALGFGDLVEKAQEERASITGRDIFLPHHLSEETTQRLRELLQKHDFIAQALLVRKEVRHLHEKPFVILGLATRQSAAKFFGTQDAGELLGRVMADLQLWEDNPVSCTVLVEGSSAAIGKKMRAVPDALIYERPK